jgi:adenylosuccinate lyase
MKVIMKNQNLEAIWSLEFWENEAERIELTYWELIKDKLPNVPAAFNLSIGSEHRFEQFIRKLSRKRNIGNLHVGLTSSDLEDNIRCKRLKRSHYFLSGNLDSLHETIQHAVPTFKVKAYTHLIEAGKIGLWERMDPLQETFDNIQKPRFNYKGIGGSIGINHVQEYLGIKQSSLREIISPFCQESKSQTGNHLTELEFAQWIQANAALLMKFCNDMRMMFAFGQARHSAGDVASTAIVSKQTPNPWRWEKASSLLDLLLDMPGQVARIMGNCLLERTLTNQSALNQIFERGTKDFAAIIELISEAWSKTEFMSDIVGEIENAEITMIKLIQEKGIGREEAYRILNTNIK